MTRAYPSVSPDAATADGRFLGRVALFLKGFGPGGVERIALRLAEGWRTAGLDVKVTVAAATGPMRHPSKGWHVAPSWPIIGHGRPMLRLILASCREMRRAPPTLFFCPGNAYTIIAVMLKLAFGRRCPPIVAKISNDLTRADMHWAIRPLYRLWLRIQGRMIDHFAVLSPPMGDEVATLMRVPGARIHIVPNPVLTRADLATASAAPPRRPSGEGRRFVAVGRLEAQKDYPAMLRAFAAGARPDDRLTIYGEGRAHAALKAIVRTLGIGDRVDLAGFSADILDHLRGHDILLLSSRYEGQPGAVVEALATGLDVIATRCCAGMDDLLDHGALGRLIDVGDEAAFAQAIADAAPGAQDRRRALDKASGFTIEKAVPAYIALFTIAIAQWQGHVGGMRGRSIPSATVARTA